jgi:hypothetical protein
MIEFLLTVSAFCSTFGTCYQHNDVLQVPYTPLKEQQMLRPEDYPRYRLNGKVMVLVPEHSI